MARSRIRRVHSIGIVLFLSLICCVLCKKHLILRRIVRLQLATCTCIMEELEEYSAVRLYSVYNMSFTIGSEVEIPLEKSDKSWNSSTCEVWEEDPSPVWPGGPPPWWENDYAGHIYENLKKSENESPDIGFESPNLYDRPYLVVAIPDIF